jgi:hypothetical protein
VPQQPTLAQSDAQARQLDGMGLNRLAAPGVLSEGRGTRAIPMEAVTMGWQLFAYWSRRILGNVDPGDPAVDNSLVMDEFETRDQP